MRSAICGTSHPYWLSRLSSKEADAQMELLDDIVSYRVAPRNFIINHFGGIVISGYGKFGDNCQTEMVSPWSECVGSVTNVVPVINDNVDFGAGVKPLRPIRVDENV